MPAEGLIRLGAAFAGPGLGALLRAAGAAGAAADGALALFCALTGAANAMAMIAALAATVKVFKVMPTLLNTRCPTRLRQRQAIAFRSGRQPHRQKRRGAAMRRRAVTIFRED